MTGKERVAATIRGEDRDRMPIYGWLFNKDFRPKVVKKYGSLDGFEDKYEFDMEHLFPKTDVYDKDKYDYIKDTFFEDALPEIEFLDPLTASDFSSTEIAVAYHREKTGRFTYAQTPGCFEFLNNIFGIENHLAYLLMHTEQLAELYMKLARRNIIYAEKLIDIGVDMIHVSDDWGAQTGPMFSEKLWWDIVYPSHKLLIDAVKNRGAFISLHCDGNCAPLLDGIVALGYDVVHPYQESAGMDFDLYFDQYRDKFTIFGGLDIQTTLGFGNYEKLEAEIRRVISKFKDGGMILCTTHMIQPHCTIEEAEFAYDLIAKLIHNQ